MMVKLISIVVVACGVLLLTGCHHESTTQSGITVTSAKVDSQDVAVRKAITFLEEKNVDTSRHDMTSPEGIQKIEDQGQIGWRVSWKLKNFTGKGGQLVIIVYESGNIQQGWGE